MQGICVTISQALNDDGVFEPAEGEKMEGGEEEPVGGGGEKEGAQGSQETEGGEEDEDEEESESDEDDVQIHIGPIETQTAPFYQGRLPSTSSA